MQAEEIPLISKSSLRSRQAKVCVIPKSKWKTPLTPSYIFFSSYNMFWFCSCKNPGGNKQYIWFAVIALYRLVIIYFSLSVYLNNIFVCYLVLDARETDCFWSCSFDEITAQAIGLIHAVTSEIMVLSCQLCYFQFFWD